MMKSHLDMIEENDVSKETNTRTKILAEASDLINGQRAEDYGPPAESFGTLAGLWSAYLGHSVSITPSDACNMLCLLKISRMTKGRHHRDSAVDGAGYLALGAECSEDEG